MVSDNTSSFSTYKAVLSVASILHAVILSPFLLVAFLLEKFAPVHIVQALYSAIFKAVFHSTSYLDRKVVHPYKLADYSFRFINAMPARVNHYFLRLYTDMLGMLFVLLPNMATEDEQKNLSPNARVVNMYMRLKDAMVMDIPRATFSMASFDNLVPRPTANANSRTKLSKTRSSHFTADESGISYTFHGKACAKGAILIQTTEAAALTETPIILWFYAGAYIAGKAECWEGYVASIGQQIGCNGFLCDYRCGVDGSIDKSCEDALSAYKYLINELNIDPSNIILGGCSSGGGLAMMTLTTGIVEEGLSMPRAVFGVSPFLDLSRSTKSAQKPDEAFISPLVCDFVESLTPLVVPPVGDAKQWSPLFHAIPANFPPCYISASQNEICTDEIIGFVDKLRANDVEVQLDMQPHLIHAFTLMYPLFDEAKVAHAKMVKWLDEQVNC